MPEDEGDQGFELPAICHPKSVNSGCFHTAQNVRDMNKLHILGGLQFLSL